MQELLFLCHRLPFPPNKGDKIRSYHLLRYLAEKYRVHLGTFVDDSADWQHAAAVRELCVDTCIRPLSPWPARLRALRALGRAGPLTVSYYHDKIMGDWVDRTLAAGTVSTVLAFSAAMAPFMLRGQVNRRVMDFVDVDSDKWRQYADTRAGLARMIYRREARCLGTFERQVAAQCDACVFVSGTEAEFFRQRVPELAGRVHGIANGVDMEYWNPALGYPNPYGMEERVLVFVGAMDYWANAEGVRWFVRSVWPRIKSELPAARFYIVGAHPGRAVRALAGIGGVVVTGEVADVRPYVSHAYAVVAPLRIARGIQNKVLEALAMGKVLLSTPQAYEGIEEFKARPGCVSDKPEMLASEALRWLTGPRPGWFSAVREHMLSHYRWRQTIAQFEALLEGPIGAGRDAGVPGTIQTEAVRV